MNPKLELEGAFNSIGETMLPDEKCCQLLAWHLEFGGAQEATVHNANLNADLQIAQKRLNIYGAEIPNAKLLPMLQEKIQECKKYDGNSPEWITDIFDRYGGLTNPFGKSIRKDKKK